jgi:threonine synthase
VSEEHHGGGVWRHAASLPVSDPARHALSLGEGDTPLVPVDAALPGDVVAPARVLLKAEHLNPTGSYKDRIAAVAVAIARERGLGGLVGTSSGNGGAAVAAYAASAGLPVTLLVVPGAPSAKLMQIRCFGARLLELRGLGWDAAGTLAAAEEVVRVATRKHLLPFVTARRFSPEAMDGAKTISYELVEQVPEADVVYVPVGGGGLLASVWRGFSDRAAQLDRPPPRLVAVQPAGSATVRRALAGAPAMLDEPVTTSVSGLQMGALFDTVDVVEAIRSSGGHLTEVTDREVWEAQARLARTAGTLVEPAGAVALAGVTADAAAGRFDGRETVVVLGTGAGLKDSDALQRLAGAEPLAEVSLDELEGAFVELE